MTDDAAGFAAELIPASRVGHAPKFAGHEDPAHGHAPNRHDDRTRAFCLVIEPPLEDSLLDTWLDLLRSLTGPDMLRIKSIINLRGRAAPVVIRCVQHLFHPPVELPAWPDDDRLSKIVFITCDVARQTIERKASAPCSMSGRSLERPHWRRHERGLGPGRCDGRADGVNIPGASQDDRRSRWACSGASAYRQRVRSHLRIWTAEGWDRSCTALVRPDDSGDIHESRVRGLR
jgi:hypothetical protein